MGVWFFWNPHSIVDQWDYQPQLHMEANSLMENSILNPPLGGKPHNKKK